MNRIIFAILLLYAMSCGSTAVAQKSRQATPSQRNIESLMTIDSISCIDFCADTIIFNGADWSPLFRSIGLLQDTAQVEQNVVSIVHIGDSHVQAGFFTEAMRIPMQMKWGNAGRGLITPLKISNTNEPFDYRFTSPGKWQFNRCLGKQFSSSVGVSGILIEPVDSAIDIYIETMSRYGEDVKFNRFKLLHAPTDTFPQLKLVDEPEGLVVHSPVAGETCYSWDTLTNSVSLRGINSNLPSKAAIYGLTLENSNSGIIVHAVGNNSATYDCYNRIDDYGKKLASLAPHLVIISLGTNESVPSVFNREKLEREIDNLVQAVKSGNPNALLLLTTPADNKLRKTRRNKKGRRIAYYVENVNLLNVAETIKGYGVKNNIAVWDWYTISGGKGSCEIWIKENGMRKDHIHYTPKGYALQGNLLYQSILNAYEQHIR